MNSSKEGEVLDSLVELTRHKDIELLEITLAKTIYELFDAIGVFFFRVLKGQSKVYSVISVSQSGISLVHKKEDLIKVCAPFRKYLEAALQPGFVQRVREKDYLLEIRPVIFRKLVVGFLAISLKTGNTLNDNVISAFLSVYENYHELLMDYQHDTLTGLLNRKTFEERLYHLMELQSAEKEHEEPAGSKRESPSSSWGFWLGMLDIDNFKHINDTYGHVYGDEVLISLSNIMRKSFRPNDIKLRFGGEEFIVVIRARGTEDAKKVFDRFRQRIETHPFGIAGTITVSIGLAEVDPNEVITNLVGRADQALYHVKKSGKNSVSVYEELVEQGILDTKKEYGDIVLF